MMNIKKVLLFLFIFFIITLTVNVSAARYTVTITGNSVGLREDASTSSQRLANLYSGETYSAINSTLYQSKGGCSDGWYYISYSGVSGYVCASYASIKEIDDEQFTTCEDKLKKQGFPSDYVSKLCEINIKYPEWEFYPINTNLNWDDVLSGEAKCQKNYVYTSNDEYKDASCSNPYTNGWYPASKKALSYYMDPRNWLDEKHIFQFEYLKYSSDLKTIYPSAIDSILKNAEFYKYHKDNGFADSLNTAGQTVDTHPIFLASRILQELGSTTKLYNLYSGVYEGYEGYYNFFNYGVSDSCATTHGTSYCGLEYAKSKGWDSLYNALAGGATSISKNYIHNNQYTLYLQKFNVNPLNSSNLYIHQYMSNISAPSSEAISMYNSYSSSNLLQSNFKFYIPIYLNMDETINNEGDGASGSEENNTTTSISIETIIKSSGYTISDGYFTGLEPNQSISELISNISSIGGVATIFDSDGNNVTDDIVKTGYKIQISNNQTSKTYVMVLKGDTSGDGKINALDLLQVQKNILGLYTLSDAYLKAGDTSGDGKINALDLLQVQKNILGLYKIEQ